MTTSAKHTTPCKGCGKEVPMIGGISDVWCPECAISKTNNKITIKTAEELLIERFWINPDRTGLDHININYSDIDELMQEYADQARQEERERIGRALDNLIHLADIMWLQTALPGQHHPVIETARQVLKEAGYDPNNPTP
ncbi:MAG TPA: hypothetical protein VD907_06735 [Verrucomicrobiae bacterium]|nr:hypothetical protein [Verrucomicrobiae bacterium]